MNDVPQSDPIDLFVHVDEEGTRHVFTQEDMANYLEDNDFREMADGMRDFHHHRYE